MMTQLSRRQTLEQQRATKAWELVSEVKEDSQNTKHQKEDYNSWVKKVPVLILTNGLGQTLAFLKSKKDREKELLLCPSFRLADGTDVLERSVSAENRFARTPHP